MKKFLFIILIFGCYYWWSHRPPPYPDGILVKNPPVQINLDQAKPFSFSQFSIQPKAEFKVRARVLSSKRYRSGRESELAPVDLALGWGQMSNQMILDEFRISQSNRFYFWTTHTMPIPENQVIESSCNMHLISATDEIKTSILNTKKDDIVYFEGYLVDVNARDGWKWKSSMTRKDSGGGACEVVFVKRFKIYSKEEFLKKFFYKKNQKKK